MTSKKRRTGQARVLEVSVVIEGKSMAVYTKLNRQEISDFLARYDVDGLKTTLGIIQGVENSNYLLTFDQGYRLILTVFEKRTDPADLPFFFAVMEHLSTHGIHCPRPLASVDGAFVQRLKHKPAALTSFLEGSSVNGASATSKQTRQVGQALAQLHAAGIDFNLQRPNALGIDGWQTLYEKTGDALTRFNPDLPRSVADELAYLRAHWPQDLPRGLIHADLFPDNVFFDEGKLSGLIDFYFSCTDVWMYDLAVTLNAWCFDDANHWQKDKADALLEGYENVRSIATDERQALPILLRGAALRFLLTRAHDAIFTVEGAQVVAKDPMEYAAKLRFHQSNAYEV